jgi:hypothetical protein
MGNDTFDKLWIVSEWTRNSVAETMRRLLEVCIDTQYKLIDTKLLPELKNRVMLKRGK